MKNKVQSTDQIGKALKRKSKDVENVALKSKKSKNLHQNDSLPSPKKAPIKALKTGNAIKEKKKLIKKKADSTNKQSLENGGEGKHSLQTELKKNKKSKQTVPAFSEGSISTRPAFAVKTNNTNKKAKKTKLNVGKFDAASVSKASVVNTDVKKKKKKLEKNGSKSSASETFEVKTDVKKKKKKNKLNGGALNVPSASEASVVNTEVKKKKNKRNGGALNVASAAEASVVNTEVTKKKNKLKVGTLDESSASEAIVPISGIKKKKKKENEGISNALAAGSLLSKSVQKKTQKKPGKNKENGGNKAKTYPAQLGKKKNKSNYKKLVGKLSKSANGALPPKNVAKFQNSIIRMTAFKNRLEAQLSEDQSDEKKIKKRLKKVEAELKKLHSILSGNEVGNTTEVVNQQKFTGLPEHPPPAKKKQNRVELKDFLENQMKASRFRWLNENLYTSSSEEAQTFFKEDPGSFKAYHEGYAEQVSKWPVNPVDVIIKELKSSPKGTVVADLGCGEAKLAAGLPHFKVHSLDFIALKPEVVTCDMAHCPLLRSSVDVAVFCLSLMGTNVGDFLLEANRILKTGGTMEIAEVESRFESIDDFIDKVEKYGFQLKKKSPTDLFFFLTFKKTKDVAKSGKLPEIELKACVYKKR